MKYLTTEPNCKECIHHNLRGREAERTEEEVVAAATMPDNQIDIEAVLGQPAIFQILNKKRNRPEDEKRTLAAKIEQSCYKFDHAGKGTLTVDEYYNVIKLQNKVEVSKDEIRRLVADLKMDKNFKIAIKVLHNYLLAYKYMTHL